MKSNNGDTDRVFKLVSGEEVRGLGSFHKTLSHNEYGEVCATQFDSLVSATRSDGSLFKTVPEGMERIPNKGVAALTNPQAGLASDQLTHHPASYVMPPAPTVLSQSTAAEMLELYWMAVLRDVPLNDFDTHPLIPKAAIQIDREFGKAEKDKADAGVLVPGIDTPGAGGERLAVTKQNIFRLGLPEDDRGPLLSQFFVRGAIFGTQAIDQRQWPYKCGVDYLTTFNDWLAAQDSGNDRDGQAYPQSNENDKDSFEPLDPFEKPPLRYISTMRDLARFVNKDALHQAYFNAALILLSGKAEWNQGNPYGDKNRLKGREAGFGALGGPHILALVSEVATRALKIVWHQKWQVHLRLRPEAYGGLVHVQNVGVDKGKRDYGLPAWLAKSGAVNLVKKRYGSMLLPMAFTQGSPTHPAYGAGHATVAGACVTVLKAFFKMYDTTPEGDVSRSFSSLAEPQSPFGPANSIGLWLTGKSGDKWDRISFTDDAKEPLTIEGELNKLAENVAMGRSMGGVHWRTDNARSLMLGEAIAAEILADITTDLNERPYFEFRTFARCKGGKPAKVRIEHGKIYVNGTLASTRGQLVEF